MGKAFISSLRGWFDSQDVTKDVKLLAFAAVTVFAISKLACTEITDAWVSVFYGLCALTGLGGPAWALVDKFKQEPK